MTDSKVDNKIKSVLNAMSETVANVMDLELFYVVLYDRRTIQVKYALIAHWQCGDLHLVEPGTEPWLSHPFQPDRLLPDKIFATGVPVLVEDTFQHWLNDQELEYYGNHLPKSWMAVPLKSRGLVIGVAVVERLENNAAYTSKDLATLAALANRAAVAMANTYLKQSLETVNEIGQNLATYTFLGVEKILELIHQQISLLMDARDMYVALYNATNQELSFPLAFMNGKRVKWQSREVKIDGGLTEEVIKSKVSLRIGDYESWYNNRHRKLPIDEEPPKSWIGVPMLVRNEVVGIISLQNDEVRNLYGADDQAVLESMAGFAAIALENARLVEALKRTQSEIAEKERELVMSSVTMDFVHSINNLAGPIAPWLALVARELSSESSQNPRIIRYLSRIEQDIAIMLEKAHDLRKPMSDPECVDIAELIDSIVGQLRIVSSPDISISFDSKDHLPSILAIKRQISTALYSVVHNSTKAITGRGQILIEVAIDEDAVTREHSRLSIYVTDTGVGIQEKYLPTIFDYGTSYWSDASGTGYGLWRARTIIENIGGTIDVACTSKDGTKFRIVMPGNYSQAVHLQNTASGGLDDGT